MTLYNPYTDPHCMTPVADIEKENIPSLSLLNCRENETLIYKLDGSMTYPENIKSLKKKPLNDIAQDVLNIIASYGVLDLRMLTTVLNLLGIKNDRSGVNAALARTYNALLIEMFHFVTTYNKTYNTNYYRITDYGYQSVYGNGIYVKEVSPYYVTETVETVKRKLVTNQILIAYLARYCNLIESYKKDESIKINATTISLTPSLIINFKDGSVMIYEVVRSIGNSLRDQILKEKLLRYKILLETWDSQKEKPVLVICGENIGHNKEILKTIKEIKLKDVFFTHDLQSFGTNFRKHIYNFDENGNITEFALEFN